MPQRWRQLQIQALLTPRIHLKERRRINKNRNIISEHLIKNRRTKKQAIKLKQRQSISYIRSILKMEISQDQQEEIIRIEEEKRIRKEK